MTLSYRAAILHAPKTPLVVETVTAAELSGDNVLVRIKAAGLCHTDLEVIEGSLRYPMPIVLGPRGGRRCRGGRAGGARGRGRRPRRAKRGTRIAATASIATATCRSCARPI